MTPQEMIDTLIEEAASQLSSWEAEFVANCEDRLNTKGEVTKEQQEKLEELYKRYILRESFFEEGYKRYER